MTDEKETAALLPGEETGTEPAAPARPRRSVWWLIAILLLLFAAAGGIIIRSALVPVRLEAGQSPKADAFCRFSFLPLSCETDLGDPSLGAVGTHPVTFTLLGLPLHTTLTVADTTPPRVTARDAALLLGETAQDEDFIESVTDFSAYTVTVAIDGDAFGEGTHRVAVRAVDEWGNAAEAEASLTVYGVADTIVLEAGITPAEAAEALRAREPRAALDETFPDVDFTTPGTYTVPLTIGGRDFRIRLEIADTTPPAASPRAVFALRGLALAPADFVESCEDVSPVTLAFAEAPDTSRPGTREVGIVLTDAYGNRTDVRAPLTVYDIPAAITLEAGLAQADALDAILGGTRLTALAERIDFRTLPVGEHTVSVRTPEGVFPVRVTVADTTPPTARGAKVLYYRGTAARPAPSDFVRGVTDFSPVAAAFAAAPDFDAVGTQNVTIRLTDEAGNSADVAAWLVVSDDAPPPTLSGVRDLTFYVNTRPNYLTGVRAADMNGAPLTVAVDSSAVRTGVPGRYTVTYSATDERGRRAAATATVTIAEITEDVIRPLAEGVLEKILRPEMTERERARAIYDWMVAHVSYTAYADKTYWMRAAYHGFSNGRGDCYVYYAMSRILLTTAGFENLEICRDNPAKPHFWNLVYCDGAWYHFDTCPHYANYPLVSFLLTDAEVRAYSKNSVADYYSFDASLYPATP